MSAFSKQLERFSETEIDDEIVVMHLDTGDFFSLSGTAATTWRLIDGTRDGPDLLLALASEYGVDESTIAAEVDDFLARLRELGLISVV